MSLSLVASFVAHAALLLAVAVPSVRDRLIRPLDSGATAPQQAQTWAGTTAELPSGETLYDVQLTGSQGVGAIPEPPAPPVTPPAPPAAPEPAPPPPAPETTPKAPPPSPKPEEPARPAPKPESPVKPEAPRPKPPEDDDDPYADLSLPKKPPPKPVKEPLAAKPPRDPEDPSSEPEEPPPAKKPKAPAKPVAPKAPAVAANPAKPGSPGGEEPADPSEDSAPKSGLGGTGTSGGSFGAVGRAGVRDLGAAFTQAIPAACGADTTWSEIGLGDAGTFRIAIDIDENGRPKSFTPLEKNPPKQLRNLAKRTFDLLQSGTFALRAGAVTAGRQTVEVSASVAMTDRPATTGGLIELGHRFENGIGRAHFVQSTGREVRLQVRVIRVEVTAAPAGD